MELIQKKQRRSIQTITGFFSFLIALVAMAGLNASLLLDTEEFPEYFLIHLPLISLFLGFIGLFTRNRSRLYAGWGISLSIFIFIFTFMMFGLAWSINPKP